MICGLGGESLARIFVSFAPCVFPQPRSLPDLLLPLAAVLACLEFLLFFGRAGTVYVRRVNKTAKTHTCHCRCKLNILRDVEDSTLSSQKKNS